MYKLFITLMALNAVLNVYSIDTAKVLLYTEALSEKMEFPAVRKSFNGDLIYSDEDMAFFKMLDLQKDFIRIEKEGGMNSTFYSARITECKGNRYITAIQLRTGSSGLCQVRCFEISETGLEISLDENTKRIHQTTWLDFGIDPDHASIMSKRFELFYIALSFNETGNIIAKIGINPPFSTEDQEIVEAITKAYPDLDKMQLTLVWNLKKGVYKRA